MSGEFSINERYRLGLQDIKPNSKEEVRYLRRVISTSQRQIKSLLKNPKKETVSYHSEDGPQRTTNKEEAKEYKKVARRAAARLNEIQKRKDDFDPKKQTKDKVTGETKRKRIFTRKMVSGGGGMMTTFKKGKSLIEKMKDL